MCGEDNGDKQDMSQRTLKTKLFLREKKQLEVSDKSQSNMAIISPKMIVHHPHIHFYPVPHRHSWLAEKYMTWTHTLGNSPSTISFEYRGQIERIYKEEQHCKSHINTIIAIIIREIRGNSICQCQ